MLYQLQALGVLKEPVIQMKSEFFHAFIEMYNKMGDSISIQYGGSIAHHAQMGKKKGLGLGEIWTSIKRHINNVVTDPGKQKIFNLFLGIFVPSNNLNSPIWQPEQDKQEDIIMVQPYSTNTKANAVVPLTGDKWFM